MGLHTTEAIILRRYPFRETSVIVTCLTHSFGKLKGLIKGLRAQPNRYRSAMEPWTVNRIVFYDTRSSQLHLISQCEVLAPLFELQRDLETVRLSALCSDLVDAIVPLEEPQPGIYRLLRSTLERLAFGMDAPNTVRLHFIARLLRLAGFQPRLDECTGCNHPIQTTGYWSVRQGGLLCNGCLHHDTHAQLMQPEAVNGLLELSQSDLPPVLAEPLIPMLRNRLDHFLRWRLDKPLKTLN